ncbi:MAG TPA: methyltransferase domain-containing protein [Phycisphaerae bacterium]|nr:methyltransferase domain-containing protein [Phycisphaerae bacterium]
MLSCEMTHPRTIRPGRFANLGLRLLGAAALAGNKLRYAVGGYRRARHFAPRDADRAIGYGLSVAGGWERLLREYRPGEEPFAGRRILELGPGPDLAAALALLARGAAGCTAFDAHRLADPADALHDQLLARLGDPPEPRRQLDALRAARPDRLRYVCRGDFNLLAAGLEPADLVVSQAAMEHFDHPAAVLRQLATLAAPGARLLAVVDLKTHSRPLARLDPLNLYRHGDGWYRACAYRGQPNRVRPGEYRRFLADAGWTDIRLLPLAELDAGYVQAVRPRLARRFRDDETLAWSTVALLAARP